MARIIQDLNDSTFLLNGDPRGKGYVAIGHTQIVSKEPSEDPVTNETISMSSSNFPANGGFRGEPLSNVQVKDTGGTIIADGTSNTLAEVVSAINDIVNFNIGSTGAIEIGVNYFFDNTTARDDYFIANPDDLIVGRLAAIYTGTDPFYLVQEWNGASWDDLYTGRRVGDSVIPTVQDSTTQDFMPIKDSGSFVNSPISFNSTLDRLESSKNLYVPSIITDPGSVDVGDSRISSGGREATILSLSTGNRAVFNLQLYDDTNFKKPTVFDNTQTSVLIPIQNIDDTIASGITEINFRQKVQSDVQFMRIRFKPQGGVITSPFEFIIKINSITNPPSYQEIIEPTDPDLTDLGGGIWELKLNNPSMFDAGFDAYITTKNISLLGGNGFTGPILFGDPVLNNFFPWLTSQSIPVVRNNIVDESYIIDEDNMISDSNTKIPTQSSVKAYVDNNVIATLNYKGGYDAANNIPDLDVSPSGINLGDFYTITTSGLFFTKQVEVGDAIISEIDNASTIGDWTILNRRLDAEVIKNLYESNPDTNVYTDIEKTKLANISSNGAGDSWKGVGLEVTEHDPKNQTVDYKAGTYIINGMDKTIALDGNYDLTSHYTGLINYQHRFVMLYVDNDEVIKSIQGDAADKKDVPPSVLPPNDSVPIALIEIKVDGGSNPKDISNKDITDQRNAAFFNTDEFVKVDPDDLQPGHLSDKLSNDGNVTFTVIDTAGVKTIKADASGGGSALPSITVTADENVDGVDVSSLAPYGILYLDLPANREFRSLQGGIDNQLITIINLGTNTIKLKSQTGTYQMCRTEGDGDKTFGGFGGTALVYNAAKGYWYQVSSV